MKKLLILLAVLLVFLCGCAPEAQPEEEGFTIATFSYEADRANFSGKAGVELSGFRNIHESNITGIEQLLALAEDECTIDFNTITTAYDSESKIYKFIFTTEDMEEDYNGTFEVYIDEFGVTKMTVFTEPE